MSAQNIGDIEPANLTYSLAPQLEFLVDSTLILSFAINWDGVEEYNRRKHVLRVVYKDQGCYFFHGGMLDYFDTIQVYRKEIIEQRIIDCVKRDSVFWINSKGEFRNL